MCDQTNSFDLHLSRRRLLAGAGALAGATLIPLRMAAAASQGAPSSAEPHFFLHIYFSTGFDSTYMFDARAKTVTAAGKVQNYLLNDPNGGEATPWVGSNGQSTLATPLVAPLAKYKDRFTVLNGVMMSPDFDGHEQNAAFMLTGNALGGESFLPHLGEGAQRPPLDFLQLGKLYVQTSNSTAGLVLENASSLAGLTKHLNQGSGPLSPDDRLIQARLAANDRSAAGQFSAGVRRMRDGLRDSATLRQKLAGFDADVLSSMKPLQQQLTVLGEYFKRGVTRGAILVLPHSGDTHGAEEAKKQGSRYREVVDQIDQVFAYLAATPLGAGSSQSLFDATTVVVMSEFGRTLRQDGLPIDNTGTDHNPLANQVLIGGKGIKGGMVVGASDLQEVDAKGEFVGVSAAHRVKDPLLLKAISRPFDINAMSVVDTQPETFELAHYLTFGSVINTVYQLFGVKTEHYRQLSRFSGPAAVLRGLI